jgi:hypothetical protein
MIAAAALGWVGAVLADEYRDRKIMSAAAQFSMESYAVQTAIMEQRSSADRMRIIHIEPLHDGVLVLYRKFHKSDGFDIHAEYVRYTWKGWRWVWGGGSSGSIGVEPEGVYVEYFPPTNGSPRTPFPMVYGVVNDSNIRQVRVTDGEGFETIVNPISVPWDGQRSWYAWVPASAGEALTVSGIGAKGEAITAETFTRYELLPEEERSSWGTGSDVPQDAKEE